MLKLLICILGTTLLAAILLQLRQQRMEINYQIHRTHQRIESSQARLWNQQLQIATYTAPNAIYNTVNRPDLKMVPQSMNQQPMQSAGVNPDAE